MKLSSVAYFMSIITSGNESSIRTIPIERKIESSSLLVSCMTMGAGVFVLSGMSFCMTLSVGIVSAELFSLPLLQPNAKKISNAGKINKMYS